MLTIRACAAELGVSPSTVYQLVRAGRLAHARIGVGRGVIRISPADLAAYLETSHVEATGPGRAHLVKRRPYAGPRAMKTHGL